MTEPSSKNSYNSIRDNFSKGKVGDFLLKHIEKSSDLSFVTAYFTIYAYHRLKEQLEGANSLRLLFGEPRFIKNVSSSTDVKSYKIEDDTLVIDILKTIDQKSIARQCSNWFREKVEIKSMVKPDFLHGKLYHIKKPNGIEEVISGSSNFTVNGLGLGTKPNIELNMVVDSNRDRMELKEWFDALWNNTVEDVEVEDVKARVLEYLEQLYVENDPEFIYFKTLYHIFEDYLSEQGKGGFLTEKTGFFDGEIWNTLYDFQKDGVKGAINKILKHNGCIIADSVGLGKTYEALAVIRYFELLNYKVLVLCPKKLSHNWTIYQASKHNRLNPFASDRFGYTVMYHTDMGRVQSHSDADGIEFEHFNWDSFDLVVIDESHNFRGNPKDKEMSDGKMRMNRAKWLMERVIKSGIKTKVLMLSATPVNNNLRDLRNQIYLITEGSPNALSDTAQIEDIGQTLKNAQTQFTLWADRGNPDRTLKQLLERLDSSFIKLLDEMTIARSRKHIKSFYKSNDYGKFPERAKPMPVYSEIDLLGRFPTYDNLNKQILEYKLSVFNPSRYVKAGLEPKYGIKTADEKLKEKQEKANKKKKGVPDTGNDTKHSFDQAVREHYLIAMMKVNFLKRLESSIESFQISMDRTIKKIEALEKKINDFGQKKITNLQEIEGETPDMDDFEDEDEEAVYVGKKLKFNLNDLNLGEWLMDLKKDRGALNDLYNNAASVTPERDAKLKDLKELVWEKLKCDNRKIIVFTAFADTAKYLYGHLRKRLFGVLNVNMALVTGSETTTTFGDNNFDKILTNFSPGSKNRAKMPNMPQMGEIDILVATDCISEGQNLQDCDCVINYDIHWNPVRIIQRFGRIDRLGSKNEIIQLVNFWPTKDLDNYINLKERVEARMALVDLTATGEDNILNTEQIEELIEEDLKFRNKQLKRLKDEVIDLEDMSESISLTDFTLDDFRFDLIKYIENNKEKLEQSPSGLYAVVPAPGGAYADGMDWTAEQKEIIRPGAVFCLKQKGNTDGNETINPLQPYFLVYIRENGTVRYQYTNAKQILDMFRLLCLGKTMPYEELCRVFDKETKHGENMGKYTDLLKDAIEDIARVFKKRSAQKLTTDRGGLLIPKDKQVNGINDFELVTWLVIM